MNAPPISEATFMVEEARSARLDPGGGIFGTAEGAAECPCATENAAMEKKKRTPSMD
ncbi:MAG TPA: hypothetical protein VKD23_07355 [Terriglobales bacterium]|nr:hypothetical protein [Terriglobales bacterium]